MKKIMITMCIACLCSVNVDDVEASSMPLTAASAGSYTHPMNQTQASAWRVAHRDIAAYYDKLEAKFSELADASAKDAHELSLLSSCTQYRTLPAFIVEGNTEPKYLAGFTVEESTRSPNSLRVDPNSLAQLNEQLSDSQTDLWVLCDPKLNLEADEISRCDSRVLKFRIDGNREEEIVNELLKPLNIGGKQNTPSPSAISLTKEVLMNWGAEVDKRKITRLRLSLFSEHRLVSSNTYWIWGELDASL